MTGLASRLTDARTMLRARATYLRQTVARRLDPVGHEAIYQASYFDLAHRTPWLNDVPLSSPGGGTASFSQLYLLLRILRETAPGSRILELGAGISTSLIAQWVAAHDGTSVHVDDDADWLQATVPADPRSTGVHAPLKATNVAGKGIQWYDAPVPNGPFDVVLVDGPQAWNAGNRFNRLGVLQWLPGILAEQFVVLIDDASRPGELMLARELEGRLGEAGRTVHRRNVVGGNSQTLLVSEARRFAAYL